MLQSVIDENLISRDLYYSIGTLSTTTRKIVTHMIMFQSILYTSIIKRRGAEEETQQQQPQTCASK